MEKILAQISFAKEADLDNVKNQLKALKALDKFKFHSCFLTRQMVLEMGWDTEIVDLIDEVLGDEHVYEASKYEHFTDYMGNIDIIRREVANKVNRMFVLDSGTAEGVAKEIELFTNSKIIMMP